MGGAGLAGEGYVLVKPRLDPRFGSTLTSQVQPHLSRFSSGLMSAGRGMQSFGRSASIWLTAPLLLAGKAAFTTARDFGQSMANVDSIMKVSREELGRYSMQVREMATRLPQDATTLADGLYNIASSGFEGAEAMNVLEQSARAASAGITTTEVSSRAIVSALKAYGMESDRARAVSDTLFRGVDKGIMSFEELASSVGDYVGLASQLRIPLEDVVAAQAAMTLSGVNAFEAGTSLNMMLRSFLKPSKDMTDALKDLGFETGRTALQELGLQGIVEALSERVGKNTEEWIKLFPEIRGARGMMALAANDGENLNDVMGAMEDRAGATGQALERQARGPAFQFQIALNRLKDTAIDLGNTIIPILANDILPPIQQAFRWFSRLPDSTKSWVVKFGVAAAALGPIATLLGTIMRSGAWLLSKGAALGRVIAGTAGATAAAGATGAGAGAVGAGAAGAGAGAAGAGATAGGLGATLGPALLSLLMLPENMRLDALREDMDATADTISVFGARSTTALEAFAQASGISVENVREQLTRTDDFIQYGWSVRLEELIEKQGEWERATFDTGAALSQFRGIMSQANGITVEQGEAIAGTVNKIHAFGGSLNELERAQVRNLLAQGDFNGAMTILDGRLKRAGKGLENAAAAQNDYRTAADGATRSTRGQGQAFEESSRDAGQASGQVAKYRMELGRIPPSLRTRYTLEGLDSARAAMRNFRAEASDPIYVRIIATGHTGGAGQRIDAQRGWHGTVRRPTLFLAGEGGEEEDVDITPKHQRSRARGRPPFTHGTAARGDRDEGPFLMRFELDGKVISQTVELHQRDQRLLLTGRRQRDD